MTNMALFLLALTYINSIYKAPFHIDHGAEMEIKQNNERYKHKQKSANWNKHIIFGKESYGEIDVLYLNALYIFMLKHINRGPRFGLSMKRWNHKSSMPGNFAN